MPQLLSLRGRHALSPFRVAKLLAALASARPQHRVARHFRAVLAFRPHRPRADAGRARRARAAAHLRAARRVAQRSPAVPLVVVPRPGTISPWSSKATDIARNCGLDAVTRIERGIGYRDCHARRRSARRGRSRGAAAAAARPDDGGRAAGGRGRRRAVRAPSAAAAATRAAARRRRVPPSSARTGSSASRSPTTRSRISRKTSARRAATRPTSS